MPGLVFIPTVRENHRTTVARNKRKIMRSRILHAIMDLYADRHKHATTIEDVARRAGISRGTFYKHFPSIDQALVAVAHEVTDRMTHDMLPAYNVVVDDVQRVATGMRLFLTRAVSDTLWAAFVLRAELMPQESEMLSWMRQDLRQGERQGVMAFDNLQAATDSVVGATMEGIRTILLRRSPYPMQYIDSVILMTLRSLGVDNARAREAVQMSRERVNALHGNVRQTWKIQG